MNSKDTIFIRTNDRLYQNEYFSPYLRELPDRLTRGNLRERIHIYFSAIGYSVDGRYAIISVNVREFGNNGTGALLLLKKIKKASLKPLNQYGMILLNIVSTSNNGISIYKYSQFVFTTPILF